MVEVIPKHIKDVWDRWNIRGAIILSLSLQAILICFSPLRKRTPQRLLIVLVWSSYLLADWSANFAVGLISKNQGKESKPDDPPQDKKLMALWAPFLLLHLGGPDTITAFALEDNALWLRHVFGLVFQAIAGVYVVLQSLPNSLWVIIVLVFASGTIKYLERTTALYSASLDKFRDSMIQAPDPGPNYAKLMEEYKAKKEARLPTKIILIDEPDKEHRPKKLVHPSLAFSEDSSKGKVSSQKSKKLQDPSTTSAGEGEESPSVWCFKSKKSQDPSSDSEEEEKEFPRAKLHHLEIVQYAFKFFNTFKGLVVNLIFSFRERDESLEIFENLKDADEALRIIEVELGFLYDALFTKIAVLHTLIGSVSRVVASGTLVAAFILFQKKPNKWTEFHGADVKVTYTLFIVGLALDFISILLFVFSDWTCAALSSLKDNPDEALSSITDRFFNWLLSYRNLRWKWQKCGKKGTYECPTKGCGKKCTGEKKHKVLITLQRWCETINVFNCQCFAKQEEVETCSTAKKHQVLMTRFFLRRWCGNINVFNFLAFATKAEVKRIHDARGIIRRYSWNVIASPFKLLNSIFQKLSRWIEKLISDVHKWISHNVNELSRIHPWARSTIYPFYFGFLSRIPHFIKLVLNEFIEFFNIPDMLDRVHKTLFVHGEPMTKELWTFMFEELKYKSKFGDSPENAKRISLARGQWTLRDNLPENADREKLVRNVTNFDYDQSLLMWHIATELCYQKEDTSSENYDEKEHYSNREFSKIISDYMMYLLILQPSLMSEVAGIGKIRFRDTLAEADKFFHRRHIENKRDVKKASETILDVESEIDPMGVKGDRSKSVLFDASRLAKELMRMEERYGKDKWEILSKVWVELLCYAACHCDPTSHVEQLSRGAELINFVWLLMAHFGLTDQFQINKGDARAKLIIGK